MAGGKINESKLLKLFNKGVSQAEIARQLGVSRAAVCIRLRELRGKTTRAVVVKRVQETLDRKIDAIGQLLAINERANRMLNEAESDPELRLKIMGEIRGQLKLQLEIFRTIFDLEAVQEFMDEVMAVIGQVEPEARNAIIKRLNERKSVRSALRFA
jgi:predicted transcriptional regulator